MQPDDIKRMIERGLPGARVAVVGDGRHFEAEVVAAAFRGKNMLEQHRMVYAALGEKMRAEIHALSLKTSVPDAAGN